MLSTLPSPILLMGPSCRHPSPSSLLALGSWSPMGPATPGFHCPWGSGPGLLQDLFHNALTLALSVPVFPTPCQSSCLLGEAAGINSH